MSAHASCSLIVACVSWLGYCLILVAVVVGRILLAVVVIVVIVIAVVAVDEKIP